MSSLSPVFFGVEKFIIFSFFLMVLKVHGGLCGELSMEVYVTHDGLEMSQMVLKEVTFGW